MCLFPKLIKNRKYIANKKNNGVIPTFPIKNGKDDKRVEYVPVGCGKCMECMKKKSREWTVRLMEELKGNPKCYWVTLTFSDESINKISTRIPTLEGYERDNEIATIAIRLFNERIRKTIKKAVKHWFVTELGHEGTENIHLHGFMWTNDIEAILSKWQYGYTQLGKYVNEQTINYNIKYVHKIDKDHKEYKPKILCSPGIGKHYLQTIAANKNKYKEKQTNEAYLTKSGIKLALPIYYRNHIYSETEKEQLWLQMLDKQKRYVNGREINVSNNDEEYYKILEEEREKNTMLGYGDDKKNWERKRYENAKRNLNHLTRLKRANVS